MDHAALRKALVALQALTRLRRSDALAEAVDEFLRDLDAAAGASAQVDDVAAAVDAWLAQILGTLLVRVGVFLASRPDPQAVRDVLRASWVLLADETGPMRAELAAVGAALSEVIVRNDLAGARRALAAAQTWWDGHQGVVGAAARRTFRRA